MQIDFLMLHLNAFDVPQMQIPFLMQMQVAFLMLKMQVPTQSPTVACAVIELNVLEFVSLSLLWDLVQATNEFFFCKIPPKDI